MQNRKSRVKDEDLCLSIDKKLYSVYNKLINAFVVCYFNLQLNGVSYKCAGMQKRNYSFLTCLTTL